MNYTLWGVPIPDWLGEWADELLAVPAPTRYTLLWIGFIVGLITAGAAVMTGLYLLYG